MTLFETHVPSNQFRPYLLSLDGERRAAYQGALDGMLRFEREISLPVGTPVDFAVNVPDHLRRDVPELFSVERVSVSYRGLRSRPLAVSLLVDYDATPEEAFRLLNRMEGLVLPVVRRAAAVDALEAVELLHDWLVERYAYRVCSCRYVHEATGPLVYGESVCEGVAKAFKFLCDRVGLRCHVVIGMADGWSGPAGRGLHAWNLVETARGQAAGWTHVDVTFDGGLSKSLLRHDYLGLTDAQVAVDHEVGKLDHYPAARCAADYYGCHGLKANSATELAKLVERVAPERSAVEFQLPDLRCSDQQLCEAVEWVLGRTRLWGRNEFGYAISPNYQRNVFGVEFN